jgi:hypothetical protein
LGVLRGVLKGKTSKVVLGVVVLPYSAVAREMIWDLSELKSWLVARVVECMPGVDVFFVGKLAGDAQDGVRCSCRDLAV